MRMVRLFGAIFVLSIQRELSFRVNMLFQLLTTAVGIAAGLATIGIIYTQTSTLGGWSYGEAIVLLGTFQVMSGIFATFIEPNVVWFAGQIKDGKIDLVLVQPVSSLFMMTLGKCAPFALTRIAMGLVIMIVGLNQLSCPPLLDNWLCWLLLMLVGVVFTWSARVLICCIAFWAPSFELSVLYSAFWEFGRYPVDVYRQPFQFVLTYVLPIAFIATIPAYALTRTISVLSLGLEITAAFIIVFIVQQVWQQGLRRYVSAMS